MFINTEQVFEAVSLIYQAASTCTWTEALQFKLLLKFSQSPTLCHS